MVGIGRDLWRSSDPTPLIEQGDPEQVVQDGIQDGGFGISREGDSNLSGQPVPGVRHPQSKELSSHV